MAEIDFGLLVQGGRAEVRELGVLQSAIDIGRNDTFGIWVLPDGRIAYARNGSMFHVSAAAPAFPLRFAAVFASAGGKIGNVIVIDG